MGRSDDTRTSGEQKLREAIAAGRPADLRVGRPEVDRSANGASWEAERTVRAEVLVDLLTHLTEAQRPRGLRVGGARIVGRLDLEITELCPIVLQDCWLEQPIDLTQARLPLLRLAGCYLHGLHAQEMTTRAGLDLSGSTVEGEVYIPAARVGGQLAMVGTTLINSDGPALSAERLTVDNDMLCREGFRAEGEVDLAGAHIGGILDLDGARLINPTGRALVAAKVMVGQDMLCREGFHAEGEVNLTGAHIGGNLSCIGARLVNPGGRALVADWLIVDQDMICRNGFHAEGQTSLGGAHIDGNLSFAGASLVDPDGYALDGEGLVVGQVMLCRQGFSAQGEVRLTGAHIGAQLSFMGADLVHPGGRALNAGRLTVDHDMLCGQGFSTQGEVYLAMAQIGGQLAFDSARLSNPNGYALNAHGIRADSLAIGRLLETPGRVDLTLARVATFLDDPYSWPSQIDLRGFIYDALYERIPTTAGQRLDWLRRDPNGYAPQPYEQLVSVYRRAGREEDARQVAIGKLRARRHTLPMPDKAWSVLLDILVNYGYRPWLAGLWLLGLVRAGWWIFDIAYPTRLTAAKPAGQRPAFHAGLYALDLLLPIGDLNWLFVMKRGARCC